MPLGAILLIERVYSLRYLVHFMLEQSPAIDLSLGREKSTVIGRGGKDKELPQATPNGPTDLSTPLQTQPNMVTSSYNENMGKQNYYRIKIINVPSVYLRMVKESMLNLN